MGWVGLDWVGLDWVGLDWVGLDWFGLDWFGLRVQFVRPQIIMLIYLIHKGFYSGIYPDCIDIRPCELMYSNFKKNPEELAPYLFRIIYLIHALNRSLNHALPDPGQIFS